MPRPRSQRHASRRPWYRVDVWSALERLHFYLCDLFSLQPSFRSPRRFVIDLFDLDPARRTSDRPATFKPELTPLELRWLMDGRPLPLPVIFAGAGAGSTPAIVAYAADTGEHLYSKTVYAESFTGGVRVAAADFNQDGYPDLLVGPGPGSSPHIQVLDGKSGNPVSGALGSFFGYEPWFNGGVNVAAADVDGDTVPDAILAAGIGGGPRVRVLSGADGHAIADFFALDPDFRGGISVAAADMNGDGKAEIAIGAGEGGGPRVRVYDGATLGPLAGPLGSFFAFDSGFRGGVFVGADALAGDVDADGVFDLVVGSGPGMASAVKVYGGASGETLLAFSPFGSFAGGVRTALAYVNDDEFADVVVGSGPGMTSTVRVFSGPTGEQLDDPLGEYEPFGASNGGVTVAASNDPAFISVGVWYDTNGDGGQNYGESAATGVTVTIALGGTQIGSGTTDGYGYHIFGNLDSNTDYVVNATSPSGYTSQGPYTVNTGMIGTTKSVGLTPSSPPPSPPPTLVITGFNDDTGISSGDRLTKDTTLTIFGTAPASTLVTLYDRLPWSNSLTQIGSTTSDAGGLWTITYATALSEGDHELVARASISPSSGPIWDLPRPPFPISASLHAIVDTTAPFLSVTAPANTYETVPEVRVQASDTHGLATTVVLDVDLNNDSDFLDAGETGFATGSLVDGTAIFSDYSPFTVGTTVRIRARALDAAGNEGTSSAKTVAVVASPDDYPVSPPIVPQTVSAAVSLLADGTVTTFVPLDVDRSPESATGRPGGLLYVSSQAGLAPVVSLQFQSDNALAAPSQIVATLTWDGASAGSTTFSGSDLIPGAIWTVNLQPAANQSTGLHTYTIDAFVDFPGTADDVTVTSGSSSTFVVNRSGGSHGTGWAYSDIDQLVAVTGGKMRILGSGQWAFHATSGGGYDSPPGDAGVLAAAGGGYTYTLPSGEQRVFDSAGYQTKWISFDGSATVTYTYDGSNRLETVASPDGGVATFAYSSGLIRTLTAPGNRVTTFTHSGTDLTLVTDAAGGLHTFAYDASHRLTDEQWGSLRTTYGYLSGMGVRRTSGTEVNVVQPMLGGALADATSLLYVLETNGLGQVTRTVLDSLGQPITRIDPDGAVWSMTRDTEGRLTAITDPLDRTTTYTRDADGYVTGIQHPDATRVTFTYQTDHHALTAAIDELNRTTTYTYTNDGNLASIIDPAGGITTLTWSGGLLQTITDPLGRVVTHTYDGYRRLTNALVGDASTGTLLYDAWGYAAGIVDPLGATTTLVNDALGRAVATVAPDGTTATAVYDAAGLLVGSILPSGLRTSFAFDAAGRRTEIVEGVGGALERRTTAVYDAAGRAIAVVDPLGNRTTTAYDALGRVVAVTNPLRETTVARHDLAGRVDSSTDPVGRTTLYDHDARDRVVAVTDPLGAVVTSAYDAAGNRVAMVDPLGNRTTAVYDALNRVVAVVDPLGARTTAVHDAAGQLLATVDPLGNRTTTAYDARGNVRSITDALGGVVTFAYDAADRRVAVADPLGRTATAVYDSVGRVVASVDPLGNRSTAVYDFAGRLLASVDPLGNRTTAVHDALDRVVATVDALNQRHTAVYDALDRVIANVDPLGASTTATFDAAGRVVALTDPLGRTATVVYNAAGERSALVEPRGNVTLLLHDGAGRLASITDPYGAVATTTFDLAGRPLATTDPLGRTTTAIHDPAGQLLATIDPLGNRTTASYDLAGNRTEILNPLNHRTTFHYDALHRLVSVVDPLGNRSTVVFDAASQAIAWVNALDQRTTAAYDLAGRLEAVIDARGNRTTSVYDAAGNSIAVVDALNQRSTAVYDALNRTVASVDPLGNRSTVSFDAAGRVRALIDPLGQRVTFNYDAAGRNTSVLDGLERTWQTVYDDATGAVTSVDALGGRTTALYDANGRVGALYDPLGNRTSWVYDAAGQVITETDPLNANRTYSYDAAGRLASATDRLGRRIDYAYDAAGRNTTVKWYATGFLAQTQTFTYDAANNVTSAIDPDGTYTLSYDALNRVQHVDEPFNLALTFGYDAVGNRTSVEDSLGGRTTVTFDARNLQTSEEFGGAGMSKIQSNRAYDGAGRLIAEGRWKDASGSWQSVATTTYDFDSASRVTNIKTVDASSAALSNYTYTYDAANRLTSKVEAGTPTTYTYDLSGQLTHDGTSTFTYDANGNRTMAGYATGTGNRTTADGTWTYTYDAEGNVTKKSKGMMSDTWSYAYDHNNQMTAASFATTDGGAATQRVTYVYDALGNRIQRQAWDGTSASTERYGLDGWDPAKPRALGNEGFEAWVDLDGSNGVTMRRTYSPQFGAPAARQTAAGVVSWYSTDLQGSVRLVLDNSATITQSTGYEAYGAIASGTLTDRFGFAMLRHDSLTGDSDANARTYLPRIGRFSQEDPLGLRPDFNLHRYVGNSPTNSVDPSGLDKLLVVDGKAYWVSSDGTKWLLGTKYDDNHFDIHVSQTHLRMSELQIKELIAANSFIRGTPDTQRWEISGIFANNAIRFMKIPEPGKAPINPVRPNHVPIPTPPPDPSGVPNGPLKAGSLGTIHGESYATSGLMAATLIEAMFKHVAKQAVLTALETYAPGKAAQLAEFLVRRGVTAVKGVNNAVDFVKDGKALTKEALELEVKTFVNNNTIPTIGGRVPINSKYAGQVHPSGIRFTNQGFPDFGPVAVAEVKMTGLTGNYAKDAALANQAVGLKSTPADYVWHHVEDCITMQLVPKPIHNATRHTGGAAIIRNGGFDR